MTMHSQRDASSARRAREDQSWSDYDKSAPKTPWGPAQGAYNFAPGVRFFHTAGHGGLMVSPSAAKQLSGAAKKLGDYWGGAFWYEEDVAISIPLYEVEAWREAAKRKAGWTVTPEGLERSIRSYFPQYFTMVEQGVSHAGPPKKGDKLRFEKAITFGSFVFQPGEEVVVDDVTRAFVSFMSAKNPHVRFRLRMQNIMSGDVVKVGSKTASWANVEVRAGRPAFEKVVSSWMPFPAFRDRRSALEATRSAPGAKNVALAVARVAGDEGHRLGFAFDGNPQAVNALGFDVYKVVNGAWEWFADENRRGIYLASKGVAKVGSAEWALRLATEQQAVVWEKQGAVLVKPHGVAWTASFPITKAAQLADMITDREARLPPMPRDSYLPPEVRGQEPLLPEGTDLAIWLWEDETRGRKLFHGIAFQGKAQKPLWFHYFSSEAARQKMVNDSIESRRRSLDTKKQQMDERRNFEHGLKIGDIFYSSWGYDQTNVDFYEVVGLSGKQVSIRQIHEKVVRSDTSAEYVVPMPGKFVQGEPVLKKIPSKGYQGTPYLRLNSFSGASLWDGKPKYQTGPYAGH